MNQDKLNQIIIDELKNGKKVEGIRKKCHKLGYSDEKIREAIDIALIYYDHNPVKNKSYKNQNKILMVLIVLIFASGAYFAYYFYQNIITNNPAIMYMD